MRFLIKEFRRHLFRTASSISGYTLASLFIILILSVLGTNEKESFGILKGTGTHFILYIPSKTTCCSSATVSSSLFADGVYTQMLGSNLIDSVRAIEGVRDAAPYLLYQIYDSGFKSQISLGGIDTTSIATAATNQLPVSMISLMADDGSLYSRKMSLRVSILWNVFEGFVHSS